MTRLETRTTRLETRMTRLETRYSKFSSFEDRGSSQVVRVSSDCQLTFDRYCTSSVTDTRIIIIIIIIIKAKETKFLGLSFGLTYKEVQNNLQTPSYNVPLAKLLSELLFLTIIDILTTHN